MRSPRHVVLSFLLAIACGEAQSPSLTCGVDPQVDQQIADLVRLATQSGCRRDQISTMACLPVTLRFTPAPMLPTSAGRRILVLDQGMLLAATARYPSRVLAQVQIESDGRYQEYLPEVSMSKDAFHIFAAIDRSSTRLTASALQPLQSPFLDGPGGVIPDEYWAGHGNPIFDFLAEAVPTAQFVIGQHDQSALWGPRACELVASDASVSTSAIQELAARYDASFSSLQDLVERYQLDFINASWGLNRREAVDLFTDLCGSIPAETVLSQVLELEATMMRRMGTLRVGTGTSARDVITVQAATFSRDQVLAEGDPDHPSDCDSTIPHRLRVGSFFNLTTQIPVDGSGDLSYLGAAEANARACTDIFIDLGYDYGVVNRTERARSLQDTFFGIGWAPMAWPPTTSFAAPVALAELIWFRDQHKELSSGEALLDAYTGSGTRPIRDPIQNDNFEAFGLGCDMW
jgi:hypothetical protein